MNARSMLGINEVRHPNAFKTLRYSAQSQIYVLGRP